MQPEWTGNLVRNCAKLRTITPPGREADVPYAAFRLRFRALVIDMFICAGLFLILGIVAGILLEGSVAGRVAIFAVLVAATIGYEPFMVARYGGTFGHRRSNVRIVCAESDANLPFWRAAARSLIKQTFGLISFFFMFITSKAQGLHDLAARARVIVRDPSNAAESDCFQPPANWVRRLIVTIVYNVAIAILVAIASGLLVSSECFEIGLCSDSDNGMLSIIRVVWLVLAGVSILLGVTGKLPGCRSIGEDAITIQ